MKLKSSERQIFKLMLNAIEKEIEMMDSQSYNIEGDELKFRLYLVVDKLDFIEALVSTTYKDEKIINYIEKLNSKLNDWFSKVFDQDERAWLYTELEKDNIDSVKSHVKEGENNSTFYNDFGEKVNGFFVNGTMTQEQLEAYDKYLITNKDDLKNRKELIKDFIISGDRNMKERLNSMEKWILRQMLKDI